MREIVEVDPQPVRARARRAASSRSSPASKAARATGAITTLGRGGSDLTAVALGDALGARSVEIYTDVSGVMTADPRRVAGAHTIDRVDARPRWSNSPATARK